MVTTLWQKYAFNVRAFFLLLLGFILALYVSWMANASLGYGYDWLYDFYDTKEHIEIYAPQNRYRQGFELTTPAQHKALFQQIVQSVHTGGEGLDEIVYSVKGQYISLLHRAEIVHLQDVANLIDAIHALVAVIALIFLGIFVVHVKKQKYAGDLLNVRSQLVISGALITAIALIFWVLGAKDIFYRLHVLIFPEDHQWFFYYQDSLMSTLMKAPDLFAGIALQIVLLAGIVFTFGIIGYKRIMPKLTKSE